MLKLYPSHGRFIQVGFHVKLVHIYPRVDLMGDMDKIHQFNTIVSNECVSI